MHGKARSALPCITYYYSLYLLWVPSGGTTRRNAWQGAKRLAMHYILLFRILLIILIHSSKKFGMLSSPTNFVAHSRDLYQNMRICVESCAMTFIRNSSNRSLKNRDNVAENVQWDSRSLYQKNDRGKKRPFFFFFGTKTALKSTNGGRRTSSDPRPEQIYQCVFSDSDSATYWSV